MLFAQYCRVEGKAGGVWCTDRQYIRAARTLLSAEGRSKAMRAWRHAWIREGLRHKRDAWATYRACTR